jgi:hypothetical protein
MGLVGTWRRYAVSVYVVTLLVPAGVLAALLVTTTLGGSGGLGALRQVVNGPTVPPATTSAPAGPVAGPARPLLVPTVPILRRATPVAPRRHARSRTRRSTPHRLVRGPGQSNPPSVTSPTPAPTQTTTQPAPAPPPAPPPSQPRPDPIHALGHQIADTVRPLPIVGPTVSDAVQTVIDLIPPLRH